MSIWKQRAEQFKQQSAAAAVVQPGAIMGMAVGGIVPQALAAEASASVALDGETHVVPALEPEPVHHNGPVDEPLTVATNAPRGRGRPPGAKNKAKAAAGPAGADVSGSGEAEALSETAARELLNTPLPPGAVPAVERARISELAGWNSTEDAKEGPQPPSPYVNLVYQLDGLRAEIFNVRLDAMAEVVRQLRAAGR